MSKVTMTIELPKSIRTSLGDTGKWTEVPLEQMPKRVVEQAVLNGFIGALCNISRGKDEHGKANGDDVWARKREAKVKTWLGGDWASTERGEQGMTLLKEQFVSEQVTLAGMTVKACEAAIAELVKETFGKEERVTFSRYLDAVATHLAKEEGASDYATIRAEIEADLAARAEAAAEERRKASAKVDVKGIALAAFKRAGK